LLKNFGKDIVSAGSLGLPSPEETGTTFTDNAILKARAAMQATGDFALSDDSGLCVNALGGDPGLYSARWSEGDKTFLKAMARIQNELGEAPDRSAYFICVLALCWPDGTTETIEGRCDGIIAPTPRGAMGHGYDPIFIPNGETRTFAEMQDSEKNKISHRGKATLTLAARFRA